MDNIKQKTNSTLVYTGAFLFVINIITFIFLVYFDQLSKGGFISVLVLLMIGITSFITSALWYKNEEKLGKGTIIPLMAIILSFYLITQEWQAFKLVDKPQMGIDGKKVSGFD